MIIKKTFWESFEPLYCRRNRTGLNDLRPIPGHHHGIRGNAWLNFTARQETLCLLWSESYGDIIEPKGRCHAGVDHIVHMPWQSQYPSAGGKHLRKHSYDCSIFVIFNIKLDAASLGDIFHIQLIALEMSGAGGTHLNGTGDLGLNKHRLMDRTYLTPFRGVSDPRRHRNKSMHHDIEHGAVINLFQKIFAINKPFKDIARKFLQTFQSAIVKTGLAFGRCYAHGSGNTGRIKVACLALVIKHVCRIGGYL